MRRRIGLSVGDQVAREALARVVVRVEVDDTHVLLAVDVGHPRHVRIFEGVVAAHDEGNGPRPRHVAHHLADGQHAALAAQVVDGGVAVVHRVQVGVPVDHHVQVGIGVFGPRAQVLLRSAQRAGAEGGALHAAAGVEGRAHDRHVHLSGLQVFGVHGHGKSEERRDPHPSARPLAVDVDRSRLALRVFRRVPELLPIVEGGIVRVHPDDRVVRALVLLGRGHRCRGLGKDGGHDPGDESQHPPACVFQARLQTSGLRGRRRPAQA